MLFFTENTSRLRHSGVVWAIYCNVRVRPIPENTAQTLLRFERLFLKCGESPVNAPVRDETNENAESCSGDAAECGPKNISCAPGFPHRSRQGLNWIWLGYKQSLVSRSWHRLWHFGWYFWNCFALPVCSPSTQWIHDDEPTEGCEEHPLRCRRFRKVVYSVRYVCERCANAFEKTNMLWEGTWSYSISTCLKALRSKAWKLFRDCRVN